jgi:hypothetical protein
MPCTGAYADSDDFAAKWCVDVDESFKCTLDELILPQAAANIQMALAAQNACDCTVAPWATYYLRDLNLIIAAAFFDCPCVRIDGEERAAWVTWANDQLTQIRMGQLDICDGATGADWPAMGIAQQSVTDWNAARIIFNSVMAESG